MIYFYALPPVWCVQAFAVLQNAEVANLLKPNMLSAALDSKEIHSTAFVSTSAFHGQ